MDQNYGANMVVFKCCKCKESKPADQFYGSNPVSYCAPCSRIIRKEWVLKNPEKNRYHIQKWRDKNREHVRAEARKWSRNNKEKVSLNAKIQHAKRKGKLWSCSKYDIASMLKTQGNSCNYCKCQLSSCYHLDHIIPIKLGGDNLLVNLQILCATCNNKKRAIDPIFYEKKIGFNRSPTILGRKIGFLVGGNHVSVWRKLDLDKCILEVF